ncbi:PREDICTED: yjeF N-terminal domain-containing protein 3 isoform X3 [Miniopterus natalensis]|uniref:yjeF N-terminal domain-containing protein 3 isoform X3 n=1 Tax=Miniopterus natalensis TaxID=291302 RepID=UPI0007A6D7FA|nr:PREDICTED: yjeF N-terminal domain-containing protein 3 isoform X3 [Miniopterus natalensis]
MIGAAGRDPTEAPEERRFLSTEEAAALERELLEDYRFGRQQLVELCGHASAVAVTKVFPLPALSRKQRTVLVVCGPEQNGAVGLVCARHLRVFEYEPTIFYPTRSLDPLHRDLTTQCEKMDIPFLSYLPTEAGMRRPAAATPRTGCGPTCLYHWQLPSAALAASLGATTSWLAGSCPTTCAESSLCACRGTRAPTAWRRCDRHPRPRGLDARQ